MDPHTPETSPSFLFLSLPHLHSRSWPRGNVVFLSFRSLGTFSKEQLKEITVGLEKSGQRFLWAVRSPPMKEQSQQLLSQSDEDPDLDSLLPGSFLDRTREKGLVPKQWAPQVAVLSHDAVGSFVTHCGWNSVLEAVCAGVPMVAWPLYAEQRFNKTLLVELLKLALPMNESAGGLVSAAEVERRVRGRERSRGRGRKRRRGTIGVLSADGERGRERRRGRGRGRGFGCM